MWVEKGASRDFDEEGEGGVRMDSTAAAAAAVEERRRHDGSPYGYVSSRLLEPTTSVRQSMWVNRSSSPDQREGRSRRLTSPSTTTPPSVEGKATRSQLFSQRQKYVKHDPLDVGAASKGTRSSRRSSRSTSPLTRPGRITYHASLNVHSDTKRVSSGPGSGDAATSDSASVTPPLHEIHKVFRGSDSFADQPNPMNTGVTAEEVQLDLLDGGDEQAEGAGVVEESPEGEEAEVVPSMNGMGERGDKEEGQGGLLEDRSVVDEAKIVMDEVLNQVLSDSVTDAVKE